MSVHSGRGLRLGPAPLRALERSTQPTTPDSWWDAYVLCMSNLLRHWTDLPPPLPPHPLSRCRFLRSPHARRVAASSPAPLVAPGAAARCWSRPRAAAPPLLGCTSAAAVLASWVPPRWQCHEGDHATTATDKTDPKQNPRASPGTSSQEMQGGLNVGHRSWTNASRVQAKKKRDYVIAGEGWTPAARSGHRPTIHPPTPQTNKTENTTHPYPPVKGRRPPHSYPYYPPAQTK